MRQFYATHSINEDFERWGSTTSPHERRRRKEKVHDEKISLTWVDEQTHGQHRSSGQGRTYPRISPRKSACTELREKASVQKIPEHMQRPKTLP